MPGATHAVGSAIVRLPGGELVIAGSAGDLTSGDVVLVRYLSDGTLDGSFGVGGIARPLPGWTVAQGEVAMVRADDGAFFVAATVLAADGGDVLVARLGPDAAPDASFGDGGVRVVDPGGDDHAASLLLDGLGRVVVAGRGGPDDELAVLRLDPDGDLDAGFGGDDGIVTTDASGGGHGSAGNDVALQTDGKIVVAGSAGNGSDLDFALVRYDEAGVPDPTFGVGGVVTTAIPPPFVGVLANDVARAVVVQPDGRIVAAVGHEWGAFAIALARYDASGALDPTFGDGGVALAGGPAEGVIANDLVLAPNGRLVVAGHVVNLQLLSLSSTVLARFMPDGTLDATFGGASGHPGLVVINRFESLFPREAGRALLRDPDGRYVVAGLADPAASPSPPTSLELAVSRVLGEEVDEEPGDEPCVTGPATGCLRSLVPRRSTIALHDPPRGVSRLLWRWRAGEATAREDLGDPLAGTDYELCVFDGTGARVVAASAPTGGTCGKRPCWKERKNGIDYHDPERTPDGILRIRLRPGADGKANVMVDASGPLLSLPSLPLVPPVTVELQGAACAGKRPTTPGASCATTSGGSRLARRTEEAFAPRGASEEGTRRQKRRTATCIAPGASRVARSIARVSRPIRTRARPASTARTMRRATSSGGKPFARNSASASRFAGSTACPRRTMSVAVAPG